MPGGQYRAIVHWQCQDAVCETRALVELKDTWEIRQKGQHSRVVEAGDIAPYLVALYTQRVHSVA